MKANSQITRNLYCRNRTALTAKQAYWAVISLVSLTLRRPGRRANHQLRAPAATPDSTNSVNSTNVTQLAPTTVVGQLDQSRNQITPELGATAPTRFPTCKIQAQAQGENAPFNEVLLRTPGA